MPRPQRPLVAAAAAAVGRRAVDLWEELALLLQLAEGDLREGGVLRRRRKCEGTACQNVKDPKLFIATTAKYNSSSLSYPQRQRRANVMRSSFLYRVLAILREWN